MTIGFTERAWAEYLDWQRQDTKMLRRINALLREIVRTPYKGTGKPEALRHDLTGWWSRRIDEEHRLVYRIVGDVVEIGQCMHHY